MENIKVGKKYLYSRCLVSPKSKYKAEILLEYPTYYVAEIKCISSPEEELSSIYSQPYRIAIHKQDVKLGNERLERKIYF